MNVITVILRQRKIFSLSLFHSLSSVLASQIPIRPNVDVSNLNVPDLSQPFQWRAFSIIHLSQKLSHISQKHSYTAVETFCLSNPTGGPCCISKQFLLLLILENKIRKTCRKRVSDETQSVTQVTRTRSLSGRISQTLRPCV